MQKPCTSRLSAVCSDRRDFLRNLGIIGAVLSLSVLAADPKPVSHQAKSRVVIVGGEFGGATCAKYLRRLAPGLDITLIERSERYISCPFSNAVIGGLSTLMSMQGASWPWRLQAAPAHAGPLSSFARPRPVMPKAGLRISWRIVSADNYPRRLRELMGRQELQGRLKVLYPERTLHGLTSGFGRSRRQPPRV
jgi:hypothetical protein